MKKNDNFPSLKQYLVSTSFVLSLSLFSLTPAHANALDALKKFIKENQSFSANFTLTVSGKNKRDEISQGSFQLLRPRQFYWHYQQPEEQLIISDGKILWIYHPELNQVMRKSLTSTLGNSPATLLAGVGDLERDYHILDIMSKKGTDWLTAKPKAQQSEFKSFRIGFKQQQLSEMILEDQFSQTSHILFSQVKTNPRLSPQQFQFTPPKNADVLNADE